MTSWTTAHQAPLSLTVSQSLLQLMSIELMMPSNHLIFPAPFFPPAFSLSQHQSLFQRVSSSYQVAKYWSFSFSNSPSNEYSGLISFRMDWFDLLAVPGTLRSKGKTLFLSQGSSMCSVMQLHRVSTVQLPGALKMRTACVNFKERPQDQVSPR